MPILRPSRERKQVAWVGAVPSSDIRRLLAEREYRLEICTSTQLADDTFLTGTSTVVLAQTTQKPRRIVDDLATHAATLLNFGCQVVVLPISQYTTLVTDALGRLKLPLAGLTPERTNDPEAPYLRYLAPGIAPLGIGNAITDGPIERPPNQALRIVPDPSAFSPAATLLLRRAFADADEVHLNTLPGGRSGAGTYRAHAQLRNPMLGAWPQPHFVKISSRKDIINEYRIYSDKVDPYVPFHLGPHLEHDRCCLGATDGILVGDYVEESESLAACACVGRSTSSIACLFDRTLLSWHRYARKEDVSLATVLGPRFPTDLRLQPRLAQAHSLGATSAPADLRARFLRCTATPLLIGPIHGDLHANNVLVRANDAIIIDFAAQTKDPLVYEAAQLETGLLIDGFRSDSRLQRNPPEVAEWLHSIKPLYEHPVLFCGENRTLPTDPSAWFYTAVDQVRRYARQWECNPTQNQYAAALALALLRKAAKDRTAQEPEASRRAAAYFLAERILLTTFP